MQHKESVIQQQIVSHFKHLHAYNQLKPSVLYSNRNENKGMVSGARYKKEGRLAGVPDLTLISEEGVAYIEVKTPERHKTKSGAETKSRGLEKSQQEFINRYIKPFGIPFGVASSVEDFDCLINFLKKPSNNPSAEYKD